MHAGQVVARQREPSMHLGPNHYIPMLSLMWSTRCGLTAEAGPWYLQGPLGTTWCGGCLRQAGLTHEMADRFYGAQQPD
jgi:hypothetical protein